MRFSYGRASLIGFGLCCSKTWVQIQCSRVVDSVSAGSKSCNFCTFAYPVTQSPCSDPNIHECTTLMAAVRPLAGSLPQSLPKPGFPSQNPSLVTSPYLSVKISVNPQLVSRYMCRNCAAWTDVKFVKSFTVTKIPNFCQFYPKKRANCDILGQKLIMEILQMG